MAYLLDTNVVCESTKPRPDAAVLAWLEQHEEESYISTISLGEIWKGIEMLPAGPRRRGYETWLVALERDYADRVLSADYQVTRKWGALCARSERAGRKLPIIDSLLAATALAHDLTLVTRNTPDQPREVPTLNPWQD